jgi:hypothetical protein
MLMSMRSDIEATRALLSETGRWVDRLKAYEQAIAESANPDPAMRQKQKTAGTIADSLTPLTKYYATEMGNRVCYQAMQIHGGVGYMREFNVERHYRDIRVTNIYEGTSQLQVVAAISKLLGHSIDPLLDEWMAAEYGQELAPLKEQLVKATEILKKTTDVLKEKDHDIVDYHAVDLVNMAAYIINSWLLLQDAPLSERKRDLAHYYITEHLRDIYNTADTISAADGSSFQARTTILSATF